MTLPVGSECVLHTAPPPLLPLAPFFTSVHQGAGSIRPVPDASQTWRICVAGDPGDRHLQPPKPAASVHHVCQLRPEVSWGSWAGLSGPWAVPPRAVCGVDPNWEGFPLRS